MYTPTRLHAFMFVCIDTHACAYMFTNMFINKDTGPVSIYMPWLGNIFFIHSPLQNNVDFKGEMGIMEWVKYG